MAVEKFMLDADGKRILDADGKMAIHEDCCCGGAETCSCCGGDATPLTFDVVFSSVMRCTLPPVSSGLNGGTYTLTQDAVDPCLWTLNTTVDGQSVTISLQCLATVWSLTVQLTTSPHVAWYADAAISSFSCDTGASSSNDQTDGTACDPAWVGEGGYAGSATISVP